MRRLAQTLSRNLATKITCLVDNESDLNNMDLKSEFGLSLHVECNLFNILFDFGTSGDNLIHNAEQLGISLENVDVAVLSHLHYDHGGGLQRFCEVNDDAIIIISETTDPFAEFYLLGTDVDKDQPVLEPIGIDNFNELIEQQSSRIVTSSEFRVDNELFGIEIIDNVKHIGKLPNGSENLLVGDGREEISNLDQLKQDQFEHEISVFLHDVVEDKNFLISGCSHNGIHNILLRASYTCLCEVDYVFGGFHYSFGNQDYDEIATQLTKYPNTKYFTNHCTGVEAYEQLNQRMGEQIQYFGIGEVFEL